jgi:hypothetical protein
MPGLLANGNLKMTPRRYELTWPRTMDKIARSPGD